jgi:flagellar biosynthetic protein FlhB
MASPFDNDEEKTETATSYRREEFRKQGTVALSKELLSLGLFISIGFVFYFATPYFYEKMSLMSVDYFKVQKTEFTKVEAVDLVKKITKDSSLIILPIFLAAIISALIIAASQVGFYITFEPLMFDFNRMNPIQGFQRLFSSNGAMEAVKAILKSAIALTVLWFFLKSEIFEVSKLFNQSVYENGKYLLSTTGKFFFILIVALAVLAALDYAYQRFRLEKQMKMTKREAKEEYKMREGDPVIKARIKSIQRKIASRRMMENVPKADVVVTNPTHFAIALKYDAKSMHAPQVVAKGAGIIALKIKELAKFHGIPCVENKPLARTLFKELDVNQYIPRDLYKAVAEVLAYVYRLKASRALGYATV